jgi:tripartite-type tricarboxylate transporter receptor subunit TctC
MKTLLHRSLGSLVLLAAPFATASAADYPDKPIRMVVPWSPGGGSDVSGRIVAAKLTEYLGQQVVVDNRPGAAGNIGTAITAKAAADGYTILLADTGFSTGISLYQDPGYHPLKDFAPVALAAITPIVVVVHPSVSANSIKDLLALAKAQPGKLNMGSGGTGGSVHLAGEMFQLQTGTKFTHVPYKGSGPAAVDLAGGVVQLMFSTAPAVMPLIKGNRVRPIGVASNTRSVFLPDVPTVKEQGVPDFVADNWYGVLVPTGTPKPVIDRLQREIAKAVSQADARDRFAGAGLEARPSKSPQEFGAFVQADVARWADVIKKANIKME